MEDNTSLPDSLLFLEDLVVDAGLPKSVTTRSNFLSSLILGTQEADSLSGTEDRDYVFGFEGDDSIEGLGGNDFLFGGSGADTIRGGEGRDRIYSGAGRDALFGDAGDDRFRDTSGGNEIDGGEGRDTVNYRNVDGPIDFRFDVLVERSEGAPATAEGRLEVVQSGLDPDVVASIERIIGPENQSNTIDFSENSIAGPIFGPPSVFAPSIDANLSQDRLSFGGAMVTVNNFQNVLGSNGADNIVGNDENNRLNGRVGADVLDGKDGDDFLKTYEEDLLIGGGGRDTFELTGFARSNVPTGSAFNALEASVIADFESGFDRLQLSQAGESIAVGTRSVDIYEGFADLPIGTLTAGRFQILGSSDLPRDETSIAYDGTTGDLFYSSRFGDRKIATLQGAPEISAGDISVV